MANPDDNERQNWIQGRYFGTVFMESDELIEFWSRSVDNVGKFSIRQHKMIMPRRLSSYMNEFVQFNGEQLLFLKNKQA